MKRVLIKQIIVEMHYRRGSIPSRIILQTNIESQSSGLIRDNKFKTLAIGCGVQRPKIDEEL